MANSSQTFKKHKNVPTGKHKKTKFFHFNLLTISYHVTDTAFRRSSLGNLFLKVVVPDNSKHESYHTGLLVF